MDSPHGRRQYVAMRLGGRSSNAWCRWRGGVGSSSTSCRTSAPPGQERPVQRPQRRHRQGRSQRRRRHRPAGADLGRRPRRPQPRTRLLHHLRQRRPELDATADGGGVDRPPGRPGLLLGPGPSRRTAATCTRPRPTATGRPSETTCGTLPTARPSTPGGCPCAPVRWSPPPLPSRMPGHLRELGHLRRLLRRPEQSLAPAGSHGEGRRRAPIRRTNATALRARGRGHQERHGRCSGIPTSS